ncbi:ATP-binding protein [Phormidium sp. CLA17]|uniref:sensor histidine kinase n=1 Tax=Leptolyngbya sp. Cla-17 TaxID=2803751 RepID=UPI0014919E56|nr:ATP-binding protein [Leptolyngbya sp. Cla-17]MBM0741214.1 ATP-binding protein [Leptolyngbya sp. Cla-17]
MNVLEIQKSSDHSIETSLDMQSQIKDLHLHDCSVEIEQLGIDISTTFKEKSILPGVILINSGAFFGMLSRRRFLELMSRPYGPELFLKRSIKMLYESAQHDVLVLPGHMQIAEAIHQALLRSPELLYEPIVVQAAAESYFLLEVHHLLLAHSQVHELTIKLLNEQTEAKLIQTEKMASLGEMVAGIAHELLNPVNFIWGNIGYLQNYINDILQILSAYEKKYPQLIPEIAELKEELEFDFLIQDLPQIVSSIKMGSERLKKIISALRNFSHVDEAVQRPGDIHECLDNTLLILGSRIRNFVEVVKNYGDLPLINCYAGQLSQVFTNLIGNAVDALSEQIDSSSESNWKPCIEISTSLLKREISGSSTTQWVAIAIHDNGPGIPAELQSRIFETFFTTKPIGKGTGLGLAISRQIIVEKHGGHLNLASNSTDGTTFEVLLPLARC